MILIKQDYKAYLIKCECGHIIKHPKLGNDLIKCYTCGTLGKINVKYGLLDIRTKQPNLNYVFFSEVEKEAFNSIV